MLEPDDADWLDSLIDDTEEDDEEEEEEGAGADTDAWLDDLDDLDESEEKSP